MRTINIRIRLVPFLAVSMALMVGVISYQAVAIRNLQQQMLPPAVVATVNIEKVFNECALRNAMETRITKQATDFDEQLDTMRQAIARLEEDLKAFPAGSAAYKKAEAELLIASFEFRGFAEFANQKLDMERGKGKLEIYNTIKEAAAQLAQENSWDIVVINDALSTIQGRTEEAIEVQISGRRFLHVRDALDVSDQIIARLNRG